MFVTGTHQAWYENQARGYQWIWRGVPPPQNFVAPSISHVSTAQEQPDHQPSNWARLGAPPLIIQTHGVGYRFASSVQEQSDYPPISWAKYGTPPVFITPVTAVIKCQTNAQEWPDFPHTIVGPSSPGPNSAFPCVEQSPNIIQEQPHHPPSLAWAQIGTPPVPIILPRPRPATITQQEQPPFFPGFTIPAVIRQVSAGVIRFIPTVQEQPDFTPGWAKYGVFPVFVTPPRVMLEAVTTVQEQPDSGRAWTYSRPVLGVASLPQVNQYARTAQEQPDFIEPKTTPAIILTSQPLEGRQVSIKQEYPDLGIGKTFQSLLGIMPQLSGHLAWTTQELPDHPLPYKFQQYPPFTIFVPPSITTEVYTTLEVPYHPGPFTLPWPAGFGFIPAPIQPVPAIYYLLEDHYINNQLLLAGTIQMTADIGGVLPINWTPGPNVDPVNAGAVAAYTAAGPRPRGLIRTQWTQVPVRAPFYNWILINGVWTLVAGAGTSTIGSGPS